MRRRFFYKREVVEDAPPVDGISFDYNDYMTIEVLGECEITCRRKVVYGVNGRGWLYASSHGLSLYSVKATKGDFISIKYALSPGESFGDIQVSGPFNLRGNCLSLIFGDDAKNNANIKLYPKVFYNMFRNSHVVFIEESFLPATTLADSCYELMFGGCASLTTAPALPATTLADKSYYRMFWKCSALTAAPELPATTMAASCYHSMFQDCTGLTTAPELPATTLATSCYAYMFQYCSGLTNAPVLSAATLMQSCYSNMFYGCTNLISAPSLPATTLAEGCYEYMFCNCASLTNAPDLPATTLTDKCYKGMFANCTELNYIKMLAIYIFAKDCLLYWIDGVSATGTFVKNKNASWDSNQEGLETVGVPTGWTVISE